MLIIAVTSLLSPWIVKYEVHKCRKWIMEFAYEVTGTINLPVVQGLSESCSSYGIAIANGLHAGDGG